MRHKDFLHQIKKITQTLNNGKICWSQVIQIQKSFTVFCIHIHILIK